MFQPVSGVRVSERYRLIRELGRGGMGAVWEAYDEQLAAPCALKFILQDIAELADLRARFLREARALAGLQSPFVVSIRGVDEWEGALYMAMELLHGETLEQRLARDGTLAPELCLTIVEQVASALKTAHSAGIVHRDLKPENIWIWSDMSRPFVKLIDFGVAKHVLDDSPMMRTKTGALVGTPNYMSPEQAAGDRVVDHRTDLWALGVIAAQCLSGRLPFESDGLGTLLMKIIREPVPKLATLYPGAGAELEAWWARAMERNIDARFQTARELSSAFARALGRPSGHDSQPFESAPTVRAGTPLPALTSRDAEADGEDHLDTVQPLSNTRPSRLPLGSRRGSLVWFGVAVVAALGVAVALVLPRPEPRAVAPLTDDASAEGASRNVPAASPTEDRTSPPPPSAGKSAPPELSASATAGVVPSPAAATAAAPGTATVPLSPRRPPADGAPRATNSAARPTPKPPPAKAQTPVGSRPPAASKPSVDERVGF